PMSQSMADAPVIPRAQQARSATLPTAPASHATMPIPAAPAWSALLVYACLATARPIQTAAATPPSVMPPTLARRVRTQVSAAQPSSVAVRAHALQLAHQPARAVLSASAQRA